MCLDNIKIIEKLNENELLKKMLVSFFPFLFSLYHSFFVLLGLFPLSIFSQIIFLLKVLSYPPQESIRG